MIVDASQRNIDMSKSDAFPDISCAIRIVRIARLVALRAFKREFPDLYSLSAQAFERPLGSMPHHARLGEFLTEWDNELGRSPLECLADGQVDVVKRVLDARAGGS